MKPTDGTFNKHFAKFPKDLQDRMLKSLFNYCQFFGYFKDENVQNKYAYFDAPEGVDCKLKNCQYKTENEKSMELIRTLTPEERKERKIHFSGPLGW